MKDFAKSIRTMNSNKEEIIKKKKQEGAYLKVDNGQKLEFSDGTTFVKSSFSEDYRPVKSYVGNNLQQDYHKKYPTDSIYEDIKSSATLEMIKKQPWKVYDILGVVDSVVRERVFQMISEKYGIDYNDIYESWLNKTPIA